MLPANPNSMRPFASPSPSPSPLPSTGGGTDELLDDDKPDEPYWLYVYEDRKEFYWRDKGDEPSDDKMFSIKTLSIAPDNLFKMS